MATIIILPGILIARGRIQSGRPRSSDRLYGEFSVLGEGTEPGEASIDQVNLNGKNSYLPLSNYHRLVEPGEMRPIHSSFSPVRK